MTGTINSIQGRHIQAVIPRLHGYMDTNTINKGIRDETIKKFLLNRKSTKKLNMDTNTIDKGNRDEIIKKFY
jgi:hypothetical protein